MKNKFCHSCRAGEAGVSAPVSASAPSKVHQNKLSATTALEKAEKATHQQSAKNKESIP